jgi:hypothetical protein
LFTASPTARAQEDIEFVTEHLFEVAMDNRYAALPVWNSGAAIPGANSFAAQFGYADTSTGKISMSGPMASLGMSRAYSSRGSFGAFLFYDALSLTGDADERPLQTLFAPNTPIARPVDARFSGLDGRIHHYGAGIEGSLNVESRWLGAHRWVGGVLWQRMEVSDFRLDYTITSGASTGISGSIDFDTNYTHFTPFIGVEWPRSWTRWAVSPHALLAWPLPGRPLVGHITGPGFDLHGSTGDVGDPSLTIGFDVVYLPAHLAIDVGTLLMQHVMEPFIHEGLDANWVLSVRWRN